MFRVARIFRGTSPFTIFMMDQKSNPDLVGLPIDKRGKLLGKMYKELSQKQRKELTQRAKTHAPVNKRKTVPKTRSPTEFSRFVSANYEKVKGLSNSKRFSALHQLYELQKPVVLSQELKKLGVDPATVDIGSLVKPATVKVPKSVTGHKPAKVAPIQHKRKSAKTAVKKAAKRSQKK